ncbi:MAG: DUF3021 domain-containing protein [Ruminococcaceae bacterium]|nr:DUF3021 domain-containing protein [Oscillospiraceae bacterium]
MNRHVKEYLHRGMLFGGFGPIVLGIIFLIHELTGNGLSLSGFELFIAILSTYLLAFVQAGASVFNQIEEWPLAKSLACHFGSIYVAYSLCYLINSWIPFDLLVFLIFTAVFVLVYAVIWLTVYLILKSTSKRMNKTLS